MIFISNQDGGKKVSLTYRECQAKLKEYKALNYSTPDLNSKKSVLEDAIKEISRQILVNSQAKPKVQQISKARIPSNPVNYRTQDGLLKALNRASEIPMSVSLAWWFQSAQHALINNWGWTEQDAAKYIAAYHPTTSVYFATA